MSTNVGSIHYDLNLKTDGFDKSADRLKGKLDNIGDKLGSFGKKATTTISLPIAAGFGFAIKAASDLNETLNKVDVAFKDQANAVKKWSKTSINSMGLAQESALDAASLFGDMSTAMGLNTKQAAKMSMGLTQLGADMASFKNISFDRAQIALAGVYTGETEALKGLGIVMTEANLAAFAQSKGITKNIQEMTQAEKVQLRYAYVMKVTKNAQGDFARTAEGTANRIRTTNERFKELSAQLGQQLLPIANRVLSLLSGLIDKFSKLSPQVQNTILVTTGLVAVLGPLALVTSAVIRTVIALRAAFIALKLAMNFSAAAALFTGRMAAVRGGLIATSGAAKGLYAVLRAHPFAVIATAAVIAVSKIRQVFSALNDAKRAYDQTTLAFNTTDAALRAANAQYKSGKISKEHFQKILLNARASGGPVMGGSPYLVGEQGPEMFIPNRSGTIIPADKTAQMSSQVSTQIYGNINIGSEVDAKNFLAQLSRNQELAKLGIPTRAGALG